MSFSYSGVEINYHEENSCHESGCDEEGICRCGHIEDVEIASVDKQRVINAILDYSSVKDPFQLYCLSRMLTYSALGEASDFEVKVEGGYYGDEIGDIHLTKAAKALINSLVIELNSCKAMKEMVELILVQEYGHLLPRLKNLTWTIVKVKANSVVIPNKVYHSKLDKTAITEYAKWFKESPAKFKKVPRCLCTKEGSKFKLVDGYHKFTASRENELFILVGEKPNSVALVDL